MFLIFKKQAVIFEVVRINFKCNGFVCVLSFFSVVMTSGFLVLFCSFGRTLTFLLQWVAFRGEFFPKGFAEGLRIAWTLKLVFLFQTQIYDFPYSISDLDKRKNDFRHMRDARLVQGSYKRPQLTRIDLHLHSSWEGLKICQFWCRKKNNSSL